MKPSTALSVLVVDPNVTSRSRTVTTLASAGFHVVATDAFESARQRIVTSPPAVLRRPAGLYILHGKAAKPTFGGSLAAKLLRLPPRRLSSTGYRSYPLPVRWKPFINGKT